MTDPVTEFWIIANKGIKAGLITEDDARKILRLGTRKASYWDRHIVDLKMVLEERLANATFPTSEKEQK